MRVDDESGKGVVQVVLWLVTDHRQDVETGEDRVSESRRLDYGGPWALGLEETTPTGKQ